LLIEKSNLQSSINNQQSSILNPQSSGGLFLWPDPTLLVTMEPFTFRGLPGALLYGVRTFLDLVKAKPRSPDQPEAFT